MVALTIFRCAMNGGAVAAISPTVITVAECSQAYASWYSRCSTNVKMVKLTLMNAAGAPGRRLAPASHDRVTTTSPIMPVASLRSKRLSCLTAGGCGAAATSGQFGNVVRRRGRAALAFKPVSGFSHPSVKSVVAAADDASCAGGGGAHDGQDGGVVGW